MLFDSLAYLELFEDVTPAPESNLVIVVEEVRSKVNPGRWRLAHTVTEISLVMGNT
jgi:hypothetical protein